VKRVLLLLILITACRPEEIPIVKVDLAGNPARGKLLIEQYGCHACHSVPGIEGPAGMIGPGLEHSATRPLIAEKIPNTVENMQRYLENPQAVNPEGTMPNLNVTPEDARDLTAFLLTLK
jgi:cytochrome c